MRQKGLAPFQSQLVNCPSKREGAPIMLIARKPRCTSADFSELWELSDNLFGRRTCGFRNLNNRHSALLPRLHPQPQAAAVGCLQSARRTGRLSTTVPDFVDEAMENRNLLFVWRRVLSNMKREVLMLYRAQFFAPLCIDAHFMREGATVGVIMNALRRIHRLPQQPLYQFCWQYTFCIIEWQSKVFPAQRMRRSRSVDAAPA